MQSGNCPTCNCQEKDDDIEALTMIIQKLNKKLANRTQLGLTYKIVLDNIKIELDRANIEIANLKASMGELEVKNRELNQRLNSNLV